MKLKHTQQAWGQDKWQSWMLDSSTQGHVNFELGRSFRALSSFKSQTE